MVDGSLLARLYTALDHERSRGGGSATWRKRRGVMVRVNGRVGEEVEIG